MCPLQALRTEGIGTNTGDTAGICLELEVADWTTRKLALAADHHFVEHLPGVAGQDVLQLEGVNFLFAAGTRDLADALVYFGSGVILDAAEAEEVVTVEGHHFVARIRVTAD